MLIGPGGGDKAWRVGSGERAWWVGDRHGEWGLGRGHGGWETRHGEWGLGRGHGGWETGMESEVWGEGMVGGRQAWRVRSGERAWWVGDRHGE